ncbi:MAG: dihydrodipicolinate synthase family protein [Kiritimatiellaeota bacterium]|nr:dihydrodipicolinate synthase family protein [Kiritimatiellota bacterium]
MSKKNLLAKYDFSGVWSAAPTPFTASMEIDEGSVRRMVEHHIRLGVKGLFLAGTNGEGPWLTNCQRRQLIHSVIRANRQRMPIAVQVTDNSAARVLDNIHEAREEGATIAVVAQPYFFFNATPATLLTYYQTIIRHSSLPVGFYDRGRHSPVFVPESILPTIYAEPNLVIIKDSSCDPVRMKVALAARQKKPTLKLFDGDEFHAVPYLKAGYDGLLLGGGVFNGYIARQMIEAFARGEDAKAERLQLRMNRMMWAVYGGKKIACWLSGEKKLLVDMGIFRTWKNYPAYPLTSSCQKAIRRILKSDRQYLFP